MSNGVDGASFIWIQVTQSLWIQTSKGVIILTVDEVRQGTGKLPSEEESYELCVNTG